MTPFKKKYHHKLITMNKHDPTVLDIKISDL